MLNNKIKLIQKVVANLSAYIIAFFLFATTGGAWMVDTSLSLSNPQCNWWLLAITIVASLFLFILPYNNKKYFSNIVIKKIFLFIICSVTYMYNFKGDFEWYFSYFFLFIIWSMILLYCSNDCRIVWKAFVNIVLIYAIVSLFFYFVGTFFQLIPNSGKTSLNWGPWTENIKTYYNIYYESQFFRINEFRIIPRNCGIFPEGPMYNFVLCTAIACELFITKKTHWWKIIILLFTAFTTFSTTTYLFLIIAVLLYLANIVFKQDVKTIYKKIFIWISLVGFMCVLAVVVHKFTTISGSGSMSVRNAHVIACLKAWKESPILGVGFQNIERVLEFSDNSSGMSMGLPFFVATGGIVMTALIFVPYLLNLFFPSKNKCYSECAFETLFIVLYIPTAVTTYPIFSFFISYIIILNSEFQNEHYDSLKNKIENFVVNKEIPSVTHYKFIKKKK